MLLGCCAVGVFAREERRGRCEAVATAPAAAEGRNKQGGKAARRSRGRREEGTASGAPREAKKSVEMSEAKVGRGREEKQGGRAKTIFNIIRIMRKYDA